jgi:hypothetical protein
MSMRCRRAERELAAAVDGQLAPRRRRALDRHLETCAECRRELDRTAAVLHAVAALPAEAPVSLALEQSTLRRIRALDGERAGRGISAWWIRPSVPVFALAAALVAVVVIRFVTVPTGAPFGGGTAARRPDARTARTATSGKPSALAARKRSPETRLANVPKDPPPKLASAPDLFVDLPMLRHFDKLEHFDAIRMTTVDDVPEMPDGGEDRSNG